MAKSKTEKVKLVLKGKSPVVAEVISKNNENNYNLLLNDEAILNVIRKENANFNQLDEINYFTELSE